jgi:heptosyltransferase-2
MKIFIEIPTWLGDAIMTTPAIQNIISQYNDVQLTIFGSFVSTKLFQNHPNTKQIIVDNSKDKGFRYANIYNLVKQLDSFDLAFSFRKNFTTKFLLFFINAKQKFIYKRYDKTYGTHQVIRYNDFINKSLSVDTKPADLKIYQNIKDIKSIKNNKPLLGINPGATYGSAKRWYPQEFAQVATVLSQKYDIVIFGGKGEVQIAQDIENKLKQNNVKNYKNLAGKTSIQELIFYISQLDLFITNDSGPMHIAAAFKIKTLAIFGPTRDKETHQWNNPNEIIIKKEFDCAPCMKRACPLKDELQNHQCMRSIKANDLLEKL